MTPPMRSLEPESSSILPHRHDDDLSGHAHRQLIGYAGLLLPVVLVLVAAARPTPGLEAWPPLESISAYYYTGAVAIFTGLLVALSLLLLTYRGYRNEYGVADRWVARVGGVAAFLVAFFPTKPPIEELRPAWWDSTANVLHYGSAATLFLAFIVFSVWLFRKTGKGAMTAEKRRRNRIYLACGIVMTASILWAAIARTRGAGIFVPEAIALLAFAFSWLTKGRAGQTARRAAQAAVRRVTAGTRG